MKKKALLSTLLILLFSNFCLSQTEPPLFNHINDNDVDQGWTDQETAMAHTQGHDIIEVNRFLNQEPTLEQKEASKKLYKQTLEYIKKHELYDYEVAEAFGYQRWPGLDAIHYVKPEYTHDGKVLSPEHPEFLMFYPTDPEDMENLKLAGVMFLTENFYDHGPQIGGQDTIWHYHHWPKGQCWQNNLPAENVENPDDCPEGQHYAERTAEMIHIWFADHPNGMFATEMAIHIDLLKDLEYEELSYMENLWKKISSLFN